MKVTVKHFAVCYDLFFRREEVMEFEGPARVEDLLQRLEAENSRLAELHSIMRISVNWEYASADTALQDGDEVALIPPVSGG